MKRKNLIILAIVIFAIIYISFAQIFGNRRDKKNFNSFYHSEINGTIKLIDTKYHGVRLRLHSDSTEYIFYPLISRINERKIFEHFATKGDSVVKPRYQDTLILIKDGRRYSYTFQKFK